MQLTEIKKTAPAGASTPGANYESELQRLYTAISGAKRFSYDPNSDSAFGSYADMYRKNGALAMADTVGTASALTGGYGSSYAQSAGAQQYQRYLQALAGAMPEFYSMALEKYNADMDALNKQYGMVSAKEQQVYQRERDAKADAEAKEKLEYARAQDEYKKAQDAYAQLVKLVSTAGYEPDDEELAATGLTRAQADALIARYRLENGLDKPNVVYVKEKKKEDKLTQRDLPLQYILK